MIAINEILKTLEMFKMLSVSQQQFFKSTNAVERATLTITKQLINDAGLTIPEFTNASHILSEQGYIWHLIIFDNRIRQHVAIALDPKISREIIERLESSPEYLSNLKLDVLKHFKIALPSGTKLDIEDFFDKEITIKEAALAGIEVLKKWDTKDIATVILMPFKDINRLMNRLKNGEDFDKATKEGFWYNQNTYEFYIDEKIISTSYQGKPNKEHYILVEFFIKPGLTTFDYEELANFDKAIGTQPYRDAMRKFLKKHPNLKRIFTVREYNTEFHPHRYEHIP